MTSSAGAIEDSTTPHDAELGSAAFPQDPDVPSRDAHPWRAAATLTVVLIALSFAMSLYVIPALQNRPDWWLNTEAWDPVMAGRFVANGAFPYLYSARQGWIAGPLLPIVLAPVAAAEDVLGLTDNGLAAVPHPTAWLILSPYGLSLCALLLYSVRRWFVQIYPTDLENRSPLALQVAAAVLVCIPTGVVFLHFEDVLALTGIFLALSALERRPRQGALWTGLAICSKQWALLAIPTLTVRAPRGRRFRYLAGSAILPVVLYGIPLTADPNHAARAILAGRAFPMLGHTQLWVDRGAALTATAPRILVVLIALAVPLVAARRTDGGSLSAATILAIVFAARLLVEPVVFGYYLSPPLLFVAFEETARHGFPRWSLVIGGAMLGLFPFHPNPLVWWVAELGLGGALGVAVFRRAGRPSRKVAVPA
jgi:hypothetical protein